MVVLSIQVSVYRSKGSQGWGLHPIIEHSTLEDVFKHLQSGELEGASRVLLEIPDDAEFKCLIAPSTKGPLQIDMSKSNTLAHIYLSAVRNLNYR